VKAFFEMGGYAPFVWPAYGVTLAVMGLNILWARQLLKRSRKEAERRLIIRKEARGEEVAR
jgi:heme exporter protein CcmD